MESEIHLSHRFAILQTLLGVWTMAGIAGILLGSGDVLLGLVFALASVAILIARIAGRFARNRGYYRIELWFFWIGIPLFLATLIMLLIVGFFPSSLNFWMVLILFGALVLYILLAIESRREANQTP